MNTTTDGRVTDIRMDVPLERLSDREVETRKKITQQLSRFMGDTVQTYFRTLNYHWNVEGPMFYGLHKLLEEHYRDIAEGIDDVAERIRMLGGASPGSMSAFQSLTNIDEKGDGSHSSSRMVRQLIRDHEVTIASAKTSIELAESLKDFGTADLVTERLRFHEKAVWMLRSLVSSATVSL